MENKIKFNPDLHHRRSIRLKGYDYAQAGLYFITICFHEKLCIFGEIINGEMSLNIYGQIAHEEWQRTETIRNNSVLHEFIIMPNHIHGIIEILFKKGEQKYDQIEIAKFQSPTQTIGSIIRGFKLATIKKIKEKIGTGEFQFTQDSLIELRSTGDKKIKPDFSIETRSAGDTKLIPDFSIETRSGELQFAPTGITELIKDLNFKIWQRNYYEQIIRNEMAYHSISNYIKNNPMKWNKNKSKIE